MICIITCIYEIKVYNTGILIIAMEKNALWTSFFFLLLIKKNIFDFLNSLYTCIKVSTYTLGVSFDRLSHGTMTVVRKKHFSSSWYCLSFELMFSNNIFYEIFFVTRPILVTMCIANCVILQST